MKKNVLIIVSVIAIILLALAGWFWYGNQVRKALDLRQDTQQESIPEEQSLQNQDIPQWEKDALAERAKLGYPPLPAGWRLFRSEEYGFEAGYKPEWGSMVQKIVNFESPDSSNSYDFPNNESFVQIFDNKRSVLSETFGVKTAQEFYDLWYWRRGYPDESGRIVEDEKIKKQHIIDGPKMDGDFDLEEFSIGHVQRLPSGNYWLTSNGNRIGWYVTQQDGEKRYINVNFIGKKYTYYLSNSFSGMMPDFENILLQFRILN